jgi:hypothetical protein
MQSTLEQLAAAALALIAATSASAQTLDSFDGATSGNSVFFEAGPPAQGRLQNLTAASVPGGTRRLQMTPDYQATGGGSAGLNGFGDLTAFGGGGTYRLAFNFAYGTEAPMNLDLSGGTSLRLDVYVGTPLTLVVYASTQTAPGANPDASAVTLALPSLFRQSYDIPLSAFVTNSSTGQPVSWADVDGLAFFVAGAGPITDVGDAFWVERLSAVSAPVPEPVPAALLALGLVVVLWGRQHARRG